MTPAPPVSPLLRAAEACLHAMREVLRPGRAVRAAVPAGAVSDAHFHSPVCRNCGAALDTPHCGACGQKKAARLGAGDLRDEVWQSYRWFEASLVRAGLRLATQPGAVAREYVLGARKSHVHPLKLLLVAVGLLIWLLGETRYLASGQQQVSAAMELVVRYSKWSFSLGIPAIWLASMAVFRHRGGYNGVEHLVLAAYVQFVVIAANALNLLPLVWLDISVAAHKQAATLYMSVLEAAVVALAFRQFFALRWRADALRIGCAVLAFLALKKLFLFAYGRGLVQLVLWQLT